MIQVPFLTRRGEKLRTDRLYWQQFQNVSQVNGQVSQMDLSDTMIREMLAEMDVEIIRDLRNLAGLDLP